MLTKPNYKDHLRQAINGGRNTEDETPDDWASPEASIVSSVPSSSSYIHDSSNHDNNGEASSFLSVTPSMLNTSIFGSQDELSLSQMEQQEPAPASEVKEPSSRAQEPWYDRSTFESIGNRMSVHCDTEVEESKRQEQETTTTNDAPTQERTSMGAALQLGTIVMGVAGVLLILATGGEKEKSKQADKTKSKKGHLSQRKRGWLSSDW